MHYLWSNQANSPRPSLKTRNIQAWHLNMQTQAVKVQTRIQKTKISNHKQLRYLTGEKSPLSCCTVIWPGIRWDKITIQQQQQCSHGLIWGTMTVLLSNTSFWMKTVILKTNTEKRTIREMGRKRNGDIMLTDRQQEEKSLLCIVTARIYKE